MDARLKWGRSSVGRAPALQAGGQEFESLHLHSDTKVSITYLENFIQNDKMIKYLFDQDIVITVKFFNE